LICQAQRTQDVFFPFFILFPSTALDAKHVQDKAARWAKAKRPRKSRPSDIKKTMKVYELYSIVKPAEYEISSQPASPAMKKEA